MKGKMVTLIKTDPLAIIRDVYGNFVSSSQFVGKTGQVIEEDDLAYNSKYPTGGEPVLFLVDFDGVQVWIDREYLQLKE